MKPASSNSAFDRERLQALLSQTLGSEKSGEVIDVAMTDLGIETAGTLGPHELAEILDRIGEMRGLAGIAARFARRRLDEAGALTTEQKESGAWSIPAHRASQDADARARGEPKVLASELVELFASSLGQERAREAVHQAAAELGFIGESLSRVQAFAITDRLSRESGLVGTVARLARARLRLSQIRS